MKSNNTHKIRQDKDNSCAVISAIFACKIREVTLYDFAINLFTLRTTEGLYYRTLNNYYRRFKCSLMLQKEKTCIKILKIHTHTHVGIYGLRGLSIGVMVFILYKLYVLLPYTYPTPKLSPHRRRCISTFPPKNSLCMIYKHFKLWGH